jgi:uncharacterized damage-inducible protein DinB
MREITMGEPTLRELVHGKGAHVDPIACVEDISAQLAIRTVANYPHSIWQIVEHMNYWMEHELHRIAAQRVSYPSHAIESWPVPPDPASEEQWKGVRQRLSALLDQFATLAESDATQMNRIVAPDKPNSSPRTAGSITQQIVAHNSYHMGQIAMLRRQFDAWPPERGGDSW